MWNYHNCPEQGEYIQEANGATPRPPHPAEVSPRCPQGAGSLRILGTPEQPHNHGPLLGAAKLLAGNPYEATTIRKSYEVHANRAHTSDPLECKYLQEFPC